MMTKAIFFALFFLFVLFILSAWYLEKDKTVIQSNKTIISKSNGAFHTMVLINGVERLAMIDTGATYVAMSEQIANELGIDYLSGLSVQSMTANGLVNGKLIRLDSVKVGNIQLYNVGAVVLDSDMKLVLIGLSFLNRISLMIENKKIILSNF